MSRIQPAVLGALLAMAPLSAIAQTSTFLDGTVFDDAGRPVPGAAVVVAGQNVNLATKTDGRGHFAFATLGPGRYMVSISKGSENISQPVSLTAGGQEITVALTPLKTIGHTVTVTNPAAKRSGTDVGIDSTQLGRLPTGGSIAGILTQMPSAALGSNGQVHVNGDHNGINYYVDGVQLPANLNRAIGNEIDPSNIGYLDLIEGAYPAQYGEKFAAVMNIGTRAYTGPAGYDFSAGGGSFGTINSSLSYHVPVGTGGSLSFSSNEGQNSRGIDPPVWDAVHNESSSSNQFLRFSMPVHGTDFVNFDLIHSLQTYQIPPDTGNGVPASTDDNEYQNDSFVSLQYRHAIGDHGSLSFGPSFKRSSLVDTNDPQNDLAAAAGTSCTDFSDCAYYSVYDKGTSNDLRWTTDYALRSAKHEVRAGIMYDASVINADYVITLQPNNALNPSGGTYTATDTAPNVAHQQEAYLQDSWRMGSRYQLDYGLRMDAFQIFSTDFDHGFSQFSPRIKLTRTFGSRSSVYAYYGRLFVPFSFQSISPATAEALYVPGTYTGAAFDLRPQRDSLYEIGGHMPFGTSDVGIRISHKDSTDWLDDTQVGATNLHQDINFPVGRVDVQTAYIQHPLARDGRAYFSLTHSIATNSENCETQLLQNCASGGPPGGPLVAADHDQRWDANGGVLLNDARGGWFSINGSYGSGLSTDPSACNGNAFNCKVPPHLVFNVEKGVALTHNVSVSLSVQNLLDDHYAITLNNSLQGTHYAAPRSIMVQFDMKSPDSQ